MKRKMILMGVGSLLLFGCAEPNYFKPGATEADFAADRRDCYNQIPMSSGDLASSPGPMGKQGVREGIAVQSSGEEARHEIDRCLREKGWTPETLSK